MNEDGRDGASPHHHPPRDNADADMARAGALSLSLPGLTHGCPVDGAQEDSRCFSFFTSPLEGEARAGGGHKLDARQVRVAQGFVVIAFFDLPPP